MCTIASFPGVIYLCGSVSCAQSRNAIGNLTGKSDVRTHTYPASGASNVRPHAVTAAGTSCSFGYDANGNMVTRVLSGTPYTLVYDAENRLVTTKQGSTVLVSYTYDGDGALVKKVVGGQTTVYVGRHYEKNVTTGVMTKYYTLGGQRVAMRVGSNVTGIISGLPASPPTRAVPW